jgi:triosephosphate isomerase
MRKKVIAGNWKLNKNLKDALELVTLLKRENLDLESPEIVICPVFTALSEVCEATLDTNIKVGGQDLYWEESGAYTGEVSGSLLKDVGCSHVIIGHSERRQYFYETDETVNKKITAADNNGLVPIVCCGELLEERESGKTEAVLKKQMEGAFKGIDAAVAAKAIVAYEPVWAIGTGKVASPEQAEEAHKFIRGLIRTLYSADVSDNMPILYGGSVKAGNAGEILKQPNVDGALVGGASLDAESFNAIIKASCEVGV